MRTLTLQSPAKLNLYLKVLNKRKDGYHNIVTLFERIDLFDDIRFSLNREKKIRIFCDHSQVPTGPKNLIYKTAQMLRDDFALENGVDIKLTKRIPVAAGLAGGSSNAATTLLGLNKIWKLSLTQGEMLKLAAKIGSDVPFFLKNCSWAIGRGRGERVEKVPISTKLWQILVVPRQKVYSRNVYQGLNLQLTKKSDNVNILIRHLNKNNIIGAGRFLLNDLEISAFRLCSNLESIKKRVLKLGTKGVALSGSGPAVFGITESKREAQQLKSILKKRYSQVFVVRTF